MITFKGDDIRKIVVIGDRLLIRPTKPMDRTESGLYLPQGIHKKEALYTGFVIKVGPGYPIPASPDFDESWKASEPVKYIPLQAKEGDLAVYIQKSVYEITFQNENYIIAPQHAVLMVIREND